MRYGVKILVDGFALFATTDKAILISLAPAFVKQGKDPPSLLFDNAANGFQDAPKRTQRPLGQGKFLYRIQGGVSISLKGIRPADN